MTDFRTVPEQVGDLERFDAPRELMLAVAELMGLELDPAFLALVMAANIVCSRSESADLAHLLGELKPVAKDLALQVGGVALMTVASSKGLTFDVTIAIGVEEEVVVVVVFSSPVRYEHEELRRLPSPSIGSTPAIDRSADRDLVYQTLNARSPYSRL